MWVRVARTSVTPSSMKLWGGVTLYSLVLAHPSVPGADFSNRLGVPDETEPVALLKYCAGPRDENGEVTVYQRDQASVRQVDLTHRTADEDG